MSDEKTLDQRVEELEEETRDMQTRIFEIEQALLYLDQLIKQAVPTPQTD